MFYDGPSQIDGSPILGIAILRSKNEKTGNMVQTFIIRADMAPMSAVGSGDDYGICGDCRHRGDRKRGKKRTCYVDISKSVSQVFAAWCRGSYPLISPADGARYLAGRIVRIGAYGDPYAIPLQAWLDLIGEADGHTGYSHQWRIPDAAPYSAILMASADSLADHADAVASGWRTFRVRSEDQPLQDREIVCPASPEGGNRRQCINCKACDGADRPGKVSVAIVVHGAMARHFKAV